MTTAEQVIADIKRELSGIDSEDLSTAEKNILRRITSYERGQALEGRPSGEHAMSFGRPPFD
jgi:hypothetical protein